MDWREAEVMADYGQLILRGCTPGWVNLSRLPNGVYILYATILLHFRDFSRCTCMFRRPGALPIGRRVLIEWRDQVHPQSARGREPGEPMDPAVQPGHYEGV